MGFNAVILIRLVVCAFGIVGNLITFAIFLRPAFKTNSISIYCQSLAISECFIVWQFAMDLGVIFYNTTIPDQSDFLCKINFYVMSGFSSIPGWILVAFSIDKLLSMTKSPLTVLKKRHFQLTVVALIFLINLLLYLEIPIQLKLKIYIRGGYYCDVSTMNSFIVVIIVYLFASGLLPFGIMITTSIIMIVTIYRSRQRLERSLPIARKRKSRDVKFAISSLVFNFVFICFKCPGVVMYLLAGYGFKISDFVENIVLLMFYVNSSIGFILHSLSNSLFRNEFCLALGRIKTMFLKPTISVEPI